MAKVGILHPHQKLGERPARYVKNCVAELLVRRLLARKIAHRLIQMVEIREAVRIVVEANSKPQPVPIPQLLPPLAFYPPLVDLPMWLIQMYE